MKPHVLKDFTPGASGTHNDKVNHDNTSDVAESQLPGNFFTGGVVDSKADASDEGASLRPAAAIDIHNVEGLGMSDDEVTSL